MKKHSTLEKRLGYTYCDKSLLVKALTHSSSVAKTGRSSASQPPCDSNERLEFLGDRVLNLVMANYLFTTFPNFKEGELASKNAYLISSKVLCMVAEDLKLENHLQTSGLKSKTGKEKALANAVEALLGAIFLEAGFEQAKNTILPLWQEYITYVSRPEYKAVFNPKSFLQEWAQAKQLPIPMYEEISRYGKDHQLSFTVALRVLSYAEITASASTKKEAARLAALKFINKHIG